ncbi:MFS transporter [Glaciihabitans sp. dw_435]|uniref:MFS transporter n=1 Tax=Glaciihabitans sp. dw_435 TaxID=2720081 RepID=UPI0021079FD9|nr:MFS transporter [Glaciihabitans sp. dw_435]
MPDVRRDARASAAEHPNRRWIILGVAALSQLMVVLDGTIVNIALPDAQLELGMSDGTRGWVVTLYALAFGSLLLLGGRIADFWGRKRSFIVGMAGFAIASGIGGLATSGGMLLLARGFQGVFAALLAPAALAVLTVTFPSGPDRTRAFAIFGTIAGAGAAIGLLLGGVLTEYLTWNWCLLVNVPIAVIAIIAALFILKESRADGDTRYDVPGTLMITLGLGSIVYGFSRAELGWGRADTIGFLALGAVGVALFLWWQTRAANPLLPLRIIADKVRGGTFLIAILQGAAMLGALLYLTLHFQIVMGMSPLASGVASLPFAGSIIVTAAILSNVIGKVGPRILITIGPVLSAAGLLLLSRVTPDGTYLAQILPGQILFGIGAAFVFVPMQNLALAGIQPRDSGVAGAALTAAQQVGGSIGIAVFTALYTSAVASSTSASTANPFGGLVDGYSIVFIAAAIAMIVAIPIGWFMVRVSKEDFTAGEGAVHLG